MHSQSADLCKRLGLELPLIQAPGDMSRELAAIPPPYLLVPDGYRSTRMRPIS